MVIKPIPPLADWIKTTNGGMLSKRDPLLLAVDKLIERFPTASAGNDRKNVLNHLSQALTDYKRAHIQWATEARNKSGAFTNLDETLTIWRRQTMPMIPDPMASDVAYGRSGSMQEEHAHSRRGILWLFSNMTVDETEEHGGDVPPPKPGSEQASWYKKIWDAIVDYCKGMWASIVSAVGKVKSGVASAMGKGAASSNEGQTGLPSWLLKAIAKLVGELLKAVGVDGGMVLGAVKAIEGAAQKYQAWKAGKGVVVAQGTPSTVISAISDAMSRSIGEGLLDGVKGAVALVPGIGTIASKIAEGLVKLYKLVKNWWETRRLKQFIADAKVLWTERDGPSPKYKRAKEFNDWFTSYVDSVPAIAMLTLTTGCCGNKMVWLSMFADEKTPIQQGQFDAGVSYLDGHIIPAAVKYLNQCTYKLSSTDKLAQILIQNGMKYAAVTRSQAIARVVRGVLGDDVSQVLRTIPGPRAVPA